MAKKSPQLYVFSQARWDREGLRTQSETRLHAVRVLEKLLEALSHNADGFGVVLDGQSVLVEDVLEIRPERLADVAAAVRSGGLLIGPWYVTPHMQLAGPEALIRNLLIGTRFARQLGDPLLVAYMPDAPACIRQTPQILAGFGIDSAVISLGDASPAGLASWQSPDGSAVAAAVLAPGFSLDNPAAPIAKDWLSFAKGVIASAGADSFLRIAIADLPLGRSFKDVAADLAAGLKGVRVVPCALPDAIMHGHASSASALGPGVCDALRWPGGLSSRMHLKLRNQQVETLLAAWAEPFAAWAWLLDGDHSGGLGHVALNVTTHAWKKLLENHNHATIGGYTSDGVYREALHRFDQAEQLAEALTAESLQAVASCIRTDLGGRRKDYVPVVVFNAAASSRADLVSVAVTLPAPDQEYALFDDNGDPVRFDLIGCGADLPCTLRFVAADVPPAGFRTFYLRPGSAVQAVKSHRDEEPDIENEFVTVAFDALTGMFGIFDKRTGRSYSGLNHFVDEGDCGTLHEFRPLARDTVIDIATNTPIFVEREVSPVEQTLTFLQIYRLPRQLTDARDARLPLAAQFVPISIITQVRLVPGVPRIDIRASVANDAMDHRLRVRFSLGAAVQRLFVDGHYEVRDVTDTLPADSGSATIAQRSFVTLWGTDTGITIANRGLPEVAITRGPDGDQAALTLLRATGLLQIDGSDPTAGSIETPLGQCFGEAVFSYSLIPHGQDVLPAWREAWAFQSGMRAVVTGIHGGSLPTQGSLISVDNPRFVITAVKTGEDGRSLVVRGHSISDQPETVRLASGLGNVTAQEVRLDETPAAGSISPDGAGGFVFDVQPAQIVTIRLEPSAR